MLERRPVHVPDLEAQERWPTILPELQDLLGHSSHTMVKRYARLAPENLRTVASRLDAVLPRVNGTPTPHEAVTLVAASQSPRKDAFVVGGLDGAGGGS